MGTPTLYPPPLGVVFLPHGSYNGGGLSLLVIWEGSVSVSTGYLCIGYDSSGGYLFFYKIFVESNRGELSKTENNLLTGGYARNTTTGLRP